MYNVLSMLEATAKRHPQKTAVLEPNGSCTFDELSTHARAAGTWLAKQGVAPRTPVALFLQKSRLAWASMLGTVYAGAYYCVLDVRQPAPRIRSMCTTLSPSLILTDEENLEQARELLGDTGLTIACIEDVVAGEADDDLLGGIRAQATDVDPLYVNFTSGSTGEPKGVVVGHRSVLDFVPTYCSTFGIGEEDVLANQAPFDFDVSVKDLYSSLHTGATLALVPREYFSNPTQLMDWVCESGATTLTWAVSALCFVSIMGGLEYRVPTTVRRVLFSGEVMPPKQLAVWQKYLPDATYVNLYGPTEITCNCTYYVVERVYDPTEVIPMGRAFANERVLLLDENDQLVPPQSPDVVGEVCVGGSCLALGYLGDAERTAATFVQNPTNSRWIDLLYRTGDLARYNDEGDLVYVSRKDHQIKHLGQRIELGDIEAAAQSVSGVERACCLYDGNRKRLVLFYVGAIDRKALKQQLRELLPSYMVPNNTRQIEAMPLTKNGKIDRAELAARGRIKM